MKITKINSQQSFGKTALLYCQIKQESNKEKVSATLYKMDPNNKKDIDDVKYSKQTRCIYSDFLNEAGQRYPHREFYLLQNDKTGEVISCAQTSHHYRPANAKNEGFSTLIEEMNENRKYINGAEPMLAYIAKHAEERYDSTVYTAFRLEEVPSLKRAKFTETKLGEFYLPQKRYNVLIDQAEKRSQIEFLV